MGRSASKVASIPQGELLPGQVVVIIPVMTINMVIVLIIAIVTIIVFVLVIVLLVIMIVILGNTSNSTTRILVILETCSTTR